MRAFPASSLPPYGSPAPRHIHPHRLDPAGAVGGALGRDRAGGGQHVERLAVRAAEHAGEDALVGGDPFQHLAAFLRGGCTSLVVGEATQIAPSASRQQPSGTAPSRQRRPDAAVREARRPRAMSKAVIRAAKVSPTISVLPSGVIIVPFGKIRSSAASTTVPSGSTRAIRAGFDLAAGVVDSRSCRRRRGPPRRPPCRCSCRWRRPTRSRVDDRASRPVSIRSSRRSFIETTSIRPSGSQPRPETGPGAANTVSRDPVRRHGHHLVGVHVREPQPPSRQRGPSGKASPSSTVSRLRAIASSHAFAWTIDRPPADCKPARD